MRLVRSAAQALFNVEAALLHAEFIGSPDAGHGHENLFGVSLPTYALMLATLSGLSLPIGAFCGVQFAPVSDGTCAAMVALGAGCLLFAVTVESYARALHEVHRGRATLVEVFIMVGGALLGAYSYVRTNRWLEHKCGWQEDHHEVKCPGGPVRRNSECRSSRSSELDGPVRHSDCRSSECVSEIHEVWENHSAELETVPELEESVPTSPPMSPQAVRRKSVALERQDSSGSLGHFSVADSTDMPFELRYPSSTTRARARWRRLRTAVRLGGTLQWWLNRVEDTKGLRGREKGLRLLASFVVVSRKKGGSGTLSARGRSTSGKAEKEAIDKARRVAAALVLGLLLDGVPEGVLMGFLAAEGHLSLALIASLFLANFPEGLSSGSLLVAGRIPVSLIVGVWTGLCGLVGCITGITCWAFLQLYPAHDHVAQLPVPVLMSMDFVHGLTGGSMIACVASVMLPEAFTKAKDGPVWKSSGFLCASGFLLAVTMKALWG